MLITETKLKLTDTHKNAIVDAMRINFTKEVNRYDAYKYPENIYERLKLTFQVPKLVTSSDIQDAFVWKYGHWHKKNFPDAHKRIIEKIQYVWADFVNHQEITIDGIFFYWREKLQGHQNYITIVFLLHLLRSDKVPIIDQHNFRAMNFFLDKINCPWTNRKKPSRLDDMFVLNEFMTVIQEQWQKLGYFDAPDRRMLDKYLMVLGQDLKSVNKSLVA